MHQRLLTWLAALVLACCATPLLAQGLTLEISNGNASAIPVAVVPFQWQGGGAPPETSVSDVISNDLNRCGQFRTLAKTDIVESPARGTDIKFPTWRLLKQDYIVVGRVIDAGAGEVKVEFELYTVGDQKNLASLTIPGQRSDMRGIAHRVADVVYEKITGVRGAFDTRIAYVTAKGLGNNASYALMIADSDGYGPQQVVSSRQPLLSPAWSPDGRKLAYESFERGSSAIYIQDIGTGAREVVSARKGINGAPAFSPDGSKLALSLSNGVNPDIYVMDLGSRALTQITRNYAIDTEPVWAPDGQTLYFTSDRGGKPQIYQVSAGGGGESRVTFNGDANAKATVSYDGKKIAMSQGNKNMYHIAVLDRASGSNTVISPGNFDESPSFAPNASMLLYAATDGSRDVLYAVSADGRVRQRLVLADGDVRSPAWSPYRQRGQ
ncbi:MAG: Tol-Pal system beta propeller repeat protein TolB [Rudaea sp.]|uniref:Tol-Pal system beta propeller repeat protein TolB n=1 Tax=unclassified Rudaea TaxID=2627037 RepID=UPI0010F6A81C|nr:MULTISPECIES: Tol-Pal system beta propeller repeat protein TolB [unclassified Rudaea]MBN8886505.1 Tol-Pal system beta propeller repeat protein TolB [Rudaea sp.]